MHGERYFDDYTVGEVIKHWPGRTIRDFDDTWFTLMTMNTNPIHFDDHFASQSQHGRCLVNGTLVFSIVVGMSVSPIHTGSESTGSFVPQPPAGPRNSPG
jgi:acyl dehydratase